MAEKEYRYDAFISYRHVPTDMLVAERLQQMLERHKKKNGTFLRVFRDRSELPTSSDLGYDIRAALEQSRFLIVICSPEYQKSQWCMTELEYFRSIHGDSNRNVLPILVEGEPQDVFPEQMLWERERITRLDGTQELVTRRVEPLGADLRGENDRQRIRLLKVEHLRIAAPILGCGFDDLFHRQQRRRKNRLLAGACAVAAFAVAFSLYSGYMVGQIRRKQEQLEQTQWELYANESRRLAGEAMDVASEDLELAMLLADAALPEDLNDPERPLEQDAESALGNAVLNACIKNDSGGIHLKKTVPFKNDGVFSFSGLVDDEKKLVFYNQNYVWIYDGKSGALLCTIPENGYHIILNKDASVYCDTFSESLSETSAVVGAVVYDSMTGEMIGNFSGEATQIEEGKVQFNVVYYPELDRYYLILHHWATKEPTEDQVCGWIDSTGKTGTASELPDGEYWVELTGGYTENSGEEETVRMLRERYGEDAVITCTNDGRIYFIYELDGPVSSTGVQKVKTTLWGTEEKTELYSTDGRCFQSAHEEIFYSLRTAGENILQIFSYDPDNLGRMVIDAKLIECISETGTLGAVRLDVHEQGLIENLDDRNSPISVVPDPFINGYRVTPDFKHLLLLADNYDTLQLYAVDSGTLLFELGGINFYQAASCVDAEGKRVAVAYTNDGDQPDDWVVDIYDVETKSCIQTVQIPDCEILFNRGMEEAVVELSGKLLCLSFTNASYLVDLENPKDYITIAGHQSYRCYTYKIPTDRIFQDDGLLIVPGNTGFYWEKIRKVNLIYDLNEKRPVSFAQPREDYEVFYYDAATGSLILGDHGSLSVQRREKGGDFKEVYCITSKDPTAELDTVLPACDGKYLVLNGETQAEIYAISDGTLLYTLTHTGSHVPHFCVIDGVLYDVAGKVYATGEMPRYELLNTAGWREIAKELLTEDGVIRTLTDEECEQYYVPKQWQKNDQEEE